MVPELTDDYDERTTLVSWRFLFGWIGGLTISVLGYLIFFAPSAAFADGRLDPGAYGSFGFTCAVVVFAAILLCAGGTHRLIPTLKPPPGRAPFTLRRFLRELRPVLANHSYRMMIFASVFASVAGGFSDVVGLYVNTYFWEFSTAQIAMLIPGLAVGALLAFAVTRPLTERFDKKRATLYMAVFAIFFGPLLIFLRLLGVMPPNGDPVLLPLILVHATVLVATVVAIGICVASMIADVVDENELDTGLRQEGMFTSAIAFAAKSASGIGGFAAGVSLDLIRFPRTADPGAVPPEKVAALGLVVGPGLVVFYLVTLIFVSRYRITRAGHEQTLAELARRQESPKKLV
jgi:Na+/melibiose symporter-like transporter